MSYRDPEIWQLARQVSIDVHRITLETLPKFELYEEGSQIRRASKSIRANIVEGYGRERYKQEYIRFLTIAHSSCDETIDHVETLQETGSLTDETTVKSLLAMLDQLGRKLNRFIRSVEAQHEPRNPIPAPQTP